MFVWEKGSPEHWAQKSETMKNTVENCVDEDLKFKSPLVLKLFIISSHSIRNNLQQPILFFYIDKSD